MDPNFTSVNEFPQGKILCLKNYVIESIDWIYGYISLKI